MPEGAGLQQIIPPEGVREALPPPPTPTDSGWIPSPWLPGRDFSDEFVEMLLGDSDYKLQSCFLQLSNLHRGVLGAARVLGWLCLPWQ